LACATGCEIRQMPDPFQPALMTSPVGWLAAARDRPGRPTPMRGAPTASAAVPRSSLRR